MARRRFGVQHFVACAEVSVARAVPGKPYTLRDAAYAYEVPADREWPVRLDGLWVFARFVNLLQPCQVYVRIVWLDAGGREAEVCSSAPWVVRPTTSDGVFDRGWRVDMMPFPGPGRYRLELLTEPGDELLANEFILIRRAT